MNILTLLSLALILLKSIQSFTPITKSKSVLPSLLQQRIKPYSTKKRYSFIVLSHQQLHSSPTITNDIHASNNTLIFKGRRKWLGGVVNKDGSIYGIPSHTQSLLKISFTNQNPNIESITLPSTIHTKRRFKWLRGIIHNDTLFCIPSWSQDGVLKIHLKDDSMEVIPFPENEKGNDRWLYHGGVLVETNHTGAIYCIPSNANRILKITHEENHTKSEYIGPFLKSNNMTKNKWYGGIKGFDNAIYGIPYSSPHVLRIDSNTDEVSLLGNLTSERYKWHGGVLSPINGCIYGIPSHTNTILKINTTDSTITLLPTPLNYYNQTTLEQKYKWGGTVIGQDDCIYGLPSNSNTILKINPHNDEITTFGNNILQNLKHQNNNKKLINKWQGAVLANGYIYAVPCNANSILRICTINNTHYNQVELIDISYLFKDNNHRQLKDQYQGGFVSHGDIYCIPENAHGVLRIQPSLLLEDVKVDLLI